jgi:hypothetical protein
MTNHFFRIAVLMVVLSLVGCRRATVAPVVEDDNGLPKTTDVDVRAWHKLSRTELTKLTEEWLATVKNDEQAARNSADAIDLLPRLRPPMRVPVFSEAVYSAQAGFSLPPYLKPSAKDAGVAFHLARFGDREAALAIAPGEDAQLRAQIDAAGYDKEYPVEWTRLIGLVLYSSQLKLASGDVAAAARLVQVHKQLRKVLDRRAAEGPLGAVLLPAGRRALALAAKAWHDPRRKKGTLADDIDRALGEWGTLPDPMPELLPGASREAVASVVGKPVKGKVLSLHKSEETARALDLLSYPIPAPALSVLTLFLDQRDRLAEIQFTYRAKIEDVYPEASHLAYHLDEHGLPVKSSSVETSLSQQRYQAAGLSFEVYRTNRSSTLGGWVSVGRVEKTEQAIRLHQLRVLGPIELDRSFEANRMAWVPNLGGKSIVVTNRASLQRLSKGLGLPTPASVLLQRENEHDLLAELRLTWSADQSARALEGLLPGLWSAFGNPEVAAQEDNQGAFLAYTWQDERTQLKFLLPFDDKEPTLTVRDRRSSERVAGRALVARQREETERKARLEAGKPVIRLLRSPGVVNDFSLECLRLGQSKSEAEAALPMGRSYIRRDFPGGVSLVIFTNPIKGVPFWARQIFLRYANDRLAEVRLRYHEGLAPSRRGQTLLELLSTRDTGAPETIPARWNGLWSGLPRPGRAVEMRWQDDLTVRTYQRDGSGSEVILSDRTAADTGKSLGPLAFIEPGVDGCRLGDTREQVRKALKAPVAVSGGADVHGQPADSPYEMILVWYVKGKDPKSAKVFRIIGVHRTRPKTQERDVAAALSQAWGRDVGGLGALRRQEGERGHILGSYFWHDDRIRVEIYVHNDDQGARLMTEWRAWAPAGPEWTAAMK